MGRARSSMKTLPVSRADSRADRLSASLKTLGAFTLIAGADAHRVLGDAPFRIHELYGQRFSRRELRRAVLERDLSISRPRPRAPLADERHRKDFRARRNVFAPARPRREPLVLSVASHRQWALHNRDQRRTLRDHILAQRRFTRHRSGIVSLFSPGLGAFVLGGHPL